jgi:hypothetical protein
MRNSWLAWTLGVSSLIASGAGCSGKDDDGVAADPNGSGFTGGGGMPAGSGQGLDSGIIMQTNEPVLLPDSGGIVYLDAGFTGDKCVATKAVAPPASTPKIDIVWVVDSSQSMFGEQALIKANLMQFADGITKSNIDVSIVMVSKYPTLIPGSIQVPGLCPDTPPDPLAGTPLATDPRYHFVETEVGSNDTLNIARDRFPMYSQFLRPGSAVHFIVVTDDEAQYRNAASPQARAMQFQADMMMLLGRPFQYHTISSPPGMRCSSPNCTPDINQGICALIDLGCQAAAGGDTHYATAMLTKGLTASICEADWSPIFKKFQEAVIKSAPLPCDYTIPPPPKNESLDREKVNVSYTPAGATTEEQLGNVNDVAGCGAKEGWYYDKPKPEKPTKVLLCPAACTKVSAGGAMNIVYGCDTVVLN